MMTRLQFVRSIVGSGATLIGLAALSGCKDDGASGIDSGTHPGADAPAGSIDAPHAPVDAPHATIDAPHATCDNTTAVIATNHGHAIMVDGADIIAGVEKTYDIRGGSNHPHDVVVTAAMFAMLKNGTPIMVTSSVTGGHTHLVTVSCA